MKNSNDIFITNTNSAKIKSTYETSNISNHPQNKKEDKRKEKEKITENFFDYLINENSNIANFEKVTEYYEIKLRKYKHIYDQNLNIIKNKKEEIKELKVQIFKLVLNHIVLNDKEMNLYYEKMNEKLKNEINLGEHELKVYKNSFREIYRDNYNLNSKLEKISKSEKIFEQQHQQYVNIKEAALTKLLKQEDLLKTLKFYFEKIEEFNKDSIAKKQKKLKQLNYEIHIIKSDEVQNQIILKNLSEQSEEINNYIKKMKHQNLIHLRDIKLYSKNYIKDNFNMNQIFDITKEKNIDSIINLYNKLKFQNKELSSLFSIKTKRIINLNSIITTLNNEYNFILKSIKNKIKAEKEETKNDIINHTIYIDKIKIKTEKVKNYTEGKSKTLLDNLKLLINIIISSLKLISSINHSRNISICLKEAFPIKTRDDLIEKYQKYFENNIINKYKINFENQIFNKKFLKFLVYIIKELDFQIKSIISNMYNILYEKQKEKKIVRKKKLVEFDLYNSIHKSYTRNSKISEENSEIKDSFISNFNINELKKLLEEELKKNQNKLEERKKFFESEEKDFFKNKLKQEKQSKEDDNNINLIASKDLLSNNKSSDGISIKDFLQEYFKYYNKGLPEYERLNKSMKTSINLNKFNFIINYTNDFVSSRKEYEDKKVEKYRSILIKSKKIKEENEKREISKYLKQNKKLKKLVRDQYNQNISTDSEKEEKEKREELALEVVTRELAELKKPKKYILKYSDKEVSKIYERFDEIRALELNFMKNKGNFLIDSGFFNEYYFKLKKQFNENKTKAQNFKVRISKKIIMKPIQKKNNRNKNTSLSVHKAQSVISERYIKSDRQRNKKIFLKKIHGTSINRNNSEILNNFYNKNISPPKKYE